MLFSGVSVPRFGRLLLGASFVGLLRVRILDGDSSPLKFLFVALESLSHSLASSSVSELFSSLQIGDGRLSGSGVSSFLAVGVGVALLARVFRIRLSEPCRLRRCGRLLLAPGVFFHR